MLGFFKYPGSILLTVENVPDFKIQDATLEIVIESENFLINVDLSLIKSLCLK
jgi:hypothetical protein